MTLTHQPAPTFALSADLPPSPLTDEQFMAELRNELKRAGNLSDEQIADYTADEEAWLDYKADGYGPSEAVQEDMSYWD